MAGASYSIKKNRIQRGYREGFLLEEDGRLRTDEKAPFHRLYLKAIDSAVRDSSWGILSFKGNFSENTVCYVYAAAMNEDSFYRRNQPTRIEDFLCDSEESHHIKKEFLKRVGALRFVNQKDMLLYQLTGQYLYLVIEVVGDGSCEIWDMKVDLQGDNFMNTFPEIYREKDSFFHRYMSVFSTIYNDFEGDIAALPELLDLDTCPAGLLPIYGSWMGIDVGKDFLDESILRPLVKEAYQLNRIKGTKMALERVAEIVLGSKVVVLERNMMEDYISKEQMREFERLYGNSIFDVTILVKDYISEVKKSQLLFLLNQFKPIRARLHLIVLQREGALDDYVYLDMNASIPSEKGGKLDYMQEIDDIIQIL